MLDIVMPIWNRKEFVDLALQSLDKYLDFRKVNKLLLLDDYSEDGAGELASKWASKHPCAVYKQARNPGMSTAWPLFEAHRILDTTNRAKWLAIWLSDWYMCQPLIPVVEEAMALAGKSIDVLSSVTLRVTKDTLVSPKDVLKGKRRRSNPRSSVRGGFNCFRSNFLRRVRPKLTTWASISSTFNGLFRQLGITYSCHWIEPPPAFLHIDEDIPGNKLTQHFYKSEGLDVAKLLRLTQEYHKRGWCRNWVVNKDTVVRAPVGAVGVQKINPKKAVANVAVLPKAWKRVKR
jgi:hypothetical protein